MLDVRRSPEPPASLSTTDRWNGLDVRKALARDFHDKCYLCERGISIGETEVDHRIPRSHWDDGKLVWTNLFPACQSCNKRRPKRYPREGLISPGEGVEARLSQRALTSEDGLSIVCEFRSRRLGDAVASNTADELSHIHSPDTATTDRAKWGTQDLLDTIHDHYVEHLNPREMKVLRSRARGEPDQQAEAALRGLLSRRAPFTMLMRSLVHPALSDLFD